MRLVVMAAAIAIAFGLPVPSISQGRRPNLPITVFHLHLPPTRAMVLYQTAAR